MIETYDFKITDECDNDLKPYFIRNTEDQNEYHDIYVEDIDPYDLKKLLEFISEIYKIPSFTLKYCEIQDDSISSEYGDVYLLLDQKKLRQYAEALEDLEIYRDMSIDEILCTEVSL
jgi:hypothetical protein